MSNNTIIAPGILEAWYDSIQNFIEDHMDENSADSILTAASNEEDLLGPASSL